MPTSNALSFETLVAPVVRKHFPQLPAAVDACAAVFGAMALANRTKPLSLILEGGSGTGKTAVLQTFLPADDRLKQWAYRCDKFTTKAFVSHAANVGRGKQEDLDLLPRIKDKVMITKELAPLFRGRVEELEENLALLISVLDGQGLTTDSGMHGQRGYTGRYVFNWLGATTPIRRQTHQIMAQLGTRLLFYEVAPITPGSQELLKYALQENGDQGETECQSEVNNFLADLLAKHPVGSVAPDSVCIPHEITAQLVRWATLLVNGRAEIKHEKSYGEWEPVAAQSGEAPHRVINSFKELVRGRALVNDRTTVITDDLLLIEHIAVSSIPGHLRPIVRELRRADSVNTSRCADLCRVSSPTARKYLRELQLLGIAELEKGSPEANLPDSVSLSAEFQWLRLPDLERKVGGVCKRKGKRLSSPGASEYRP